MSMLNFSQFMEQLMALNPTHNQRKTERNNKIKMQKLDMKLTKLTQEPKHHKKTQFILS